MNQKPLLGLPAMSHHIIKITQSHIHHFIIVSISFLTKCNDTFLIISGSTGKIKWNDNWVGFLDSLMKIYMYSNKKGRDLMFPDRIRRLAICTSQFESVKAG